MFAQKRKLFSVTLVIYKIEPRTIVFTATMTTMMNGRVKKRNDVIKVFDKKTTVFFSLEKKLGSTSTLRPLRGKYDFSTLFYKKKPDRKKNEYSEATRLLTVHH